MRHDKNRSPFGDRRHVSLDDPLAFVIERTRGFVEDQDPRVAQGVRERYAAFRPKLGRSSIDTPSAVSIRSKILDCPLQPGT